MWLLKILVTAYLCLQLLKKQRLLTTWWLQLLEKQMLLTTDNWKLIANTYLPRCNHARTYRNGRWPTEGALTKPRLAGLRFQAFARGRLLRTSRAIPVVLAGCLVWIGHTGYMGRFCWQMKSMTP